MSLPERPFILPRRTCTCGAAVEPGNRRCRKCREEDKTRTAIDAAFPPITSQDDTAPRRRALIPA